MATGEPFTARWRINLLAGGLAGFAAAVPMGLLMKGLNRFLPGRERSGLSPKQVTARGLKKHFKVAHSGCFRG